MQLFLEEHPHLAKTRSHACFMVRDANRQALAYVYFEGKPDGAPTATFIRSSYLHQQRGR